MLRRFAALLVSALLLASCSPPPSAASASASSSAAPEAAVPPTSTEDKNASRYTYLKQSIECSAEDGIYRLVQNEDASYNIQYVDFATAQEIVLCNQPNCEHNSETCPGWIPNTGSSVSLYVLEDALLLQFLGTVDTQNAMVQVLPHFEKMDLNGANRQIFPNLPDVLMFGDAIAADKDYIIFIMNEGKNLENPLAGAQVLMKMSLANGSCQKLADLSQPAEEKEGELFIPSSSNFLIGSAADGVIVKALKTHSPYSESVSFEAMVASQEHSLYFYPGNGSSPKKLYSYMQNEQRELTWNGEIFSLLQTDGNITFVRRDLNGKETVLLENIPEFTGVDLMYITPQMLDQEHLLLLVYDPVNTLTREYSVYIYDLPANTLTKSSLEYQRQNTFSAVVPFSSCRESFFVQSDVKQVGTDVFYSETAGNVMVENPIYEPVYAFITKDDFYRSVPSYTTVKMLP